MSVSEEFKAQCRELLEKATGDEMPPGKTQKDEGYEYYGFASHGYRNTDVVNSMIAFAVISEDVPCRTDGECDWFVTMYMHWVRDHVSEEDWDDVKAKAKVVVQYIDGYRKDPEAYIINAPYWDL